MEEQVMSIEEGYKFESTLIYNKTTQSALHSRYSQSEKDQQYEKE